MFGTLASGPSSLALFLFLELISDGEKSKKKVIDRQYQLPVFC